MSKKKESDIALSSDSSGRSDFEITHPFHPDRSCQLQLLHTRVDGGVRWLWYADREGRSRQVRQSSTNRAEPDAFRRQAAGRCAFALRDLVRLAELVDRLTRDRVGPGKGSR